MLAKSLLIFTVVFSALAFGNGLLFDRSLETQEEIDERNRKFDIRGTQQWIDELDPATRKWREKQENKSSADLFILFYGTLESNGFAGGGGFHLCDTREGKERCRSLVEAGYRYGSARNLKTRTFRNQIITVLPPLEGREERIGLSTELQGEFERLDRAMKALGITDVFLHVILEKFTWDRPRTRTFPFEEVQLKLLPLNSFVKDEYRQGVLTDATDEYQDFMTRLGIESGRFTLRPTAISSISETYFFTSFNDLEVQQQLMVIIHEAFMRDCYGLARYPCLDEAHYYDGLIYDILMDRQILADQIEDLKKYFGRPEGFYWDDSLDIDWGWDWEAAAQEAN
ncbi:MAG: hypothetical protein AAF202_01885 [Pseudomonadota bacterium]